MKRAHGSILVLFARAPRAGRVKSRLAAVLGETAALEIYLAFLKDSIEMVRRVSPGGIRPAIAWAGAEGPVSEIEEMLAGFEVLDQEGDDLGQKMSNTFADLLSRGHDRVVIIGSDTPSLPLEHLYKAFDLLRDRDLVIGPATDGGYYLIGARAVYPEIFRDIPWGTARVLEETIALLRIYGIPRVLLPKWEDVDTIEDLERLRSSLAGLDPADPAARHTRQVLSRIPAGT